VRKHYSGFASEEATLRVRFEGSEITLDIPVDGLVTREGWRITPLTFPTVSGHGTLIYIKYYCIEHCIGEIWIHPLLMILFSDLSYINAWLNNFA